MLIFDAGVEHFDEHSRVVSEVNSKLLSLLHQLKPVFIENMRVVEEEVVLASELHSHFCRHFIFTLL